MPYGDELQHIQMLMTTKVQEAERIAYELTQRLQTESAEVEIKHSNEYFIYFQNGDVLVMKVMAQNNQNSNLSLAFYSNTATSIVWKDREGPYFANLVEAITSRFGISLSK